jgi:hypothetical protein
LITLLAASWIALATASDSDVRWRNPVTSTYVIAGFTLMKAGVVRRGYALPVEHTSEYQDWLETRRRDAIQIFDSLRWFLTVIVAGYAAVHTLPVEASAPIRWAAIAISILLWLWMMVRLARGTALQQVTAGLPAPMRIDWSKGWASFGVFLIGLALLLLWPEW